MIIGIITASILLISLGVKLFEVKRNSKHVKLTKAQKLQNKLNKLNGIK